MAVHLVRGKGTDELPPVGVKIIDSMVDLLLECTCHEHAGNGDEWLLVAVTSTRTTVKRAGSSSLVCNVSTAVAIFV